MPTITKPKYPKYASDVRVHTSPYFLLDVRPRHLSVWCCMECGPQRPGETHTNSQGVADT